MYFLVCGQQQSPLQTLPCGHCMCQACWNDWCRARNFQQEVVICPVCRGEVADGGEEMNRVVPSQAALWTEAVPANNDPLQTHEISPSIPVLPPRAFPPLQALSAPNGSRVSRYQSPMIAPAVWPGSRRREGFHQPEMWYGRRDEERLPLIV